MSEKCPLPVPTLETESYWKGALEGRLLIPRCEACGKWHFYPRPVCPFCTSERLGWKEASGSGSVYSHTTVYRAPSVAFLDDVPYIVAMVELDEGPHMMTRLVGADTEADLVGRRVRLHFQQRDDGALPLFEVVPE